LGKILRSFLVFGAVVAVAVGLSACGGLRPGNAKATKPLTNEVTSRLAAIGSSPGAAMMVRIFKETSELEVWKQSNGGDFKLFKTYAICAWSGDLGPKVKEGDRQSPEGFYTITPGLMNPNSNYYLAFNTGFPNKFDRAYGRTGSDLMVHGDCSSRGCYSMTDGSIAEIYALARETFAGGNPSFQLQIYPFRMTAKNLAQHADNPNMSFWQNIKGGYDRFELANRPATWDVCNRQYVFDVPQGMALDASGACPAQLANLSPDLAAKQASDAAAMQAEVVAIAKRDADAAEAERKEVAAKAAAKAQGEAIGSFIGGLFGQDQKVMDPEIVAPVPAPRPHRA
jgi:murein L,D-transpeptidase YafK